MENDYKNIIERADSDAVKLDNKGGKGDLAGAAEAVQKLFDETSKLNYGRQDLLVNSYVKELNKHADDIYGQGNHIKVEIIDSNNNMMLDKNDHVTATRPNGENRSARLGEFGGINHPYK